MTLFIEYICLNSSLNCWHICADISILSSEDDGSFSNMEFPSRGPSSLSHLVIISLIKGIKCNEL